MSDLGETAAEETSVAEEEEEDNVHPLRPPPQKPRPRPGSRRASVSGSSSGVDGDSNVMRAHTRLIEVQDSSDRLGLQAMRETVAASEGARRDLYSDLRDMRDQHDREIDRLRDEYERAADAAERRHTQEAIRWRDDRDRLQREIEGLQRDLKDAKKAKKRHKKSVAELEIKLSEIKETGETKRAVFGLLAPGVPPLANEAAKHVPGFLAFLKSLLGGATVGAPQEEGEAVKDRAAAIRFAGRLFDPKNSDLLLDLQELAFDVIDDNGTAVVVKEWDRVQRYVWSALQREAESSAPSGDVVDDAGDQ